MAIFKRKKVKDLNDFADITLRPVRRKLIKAGILYDSNFLEGSYLIQFLNPSQILTVKITDTENLSVLFNASISAGLVIYGNFVNIELTSGIGVVYYFE